MMWPRDRFTTPLRHHRHEDGFTLVEMLVSLAVLAITAVMLLNGLQAVASFAQRTDRQGAADDSIVTAQRILRDRIEQLRAVTNPNSAVPIVDANGDEGSFTFLAPPLARAEPDSLSRYRILGTATGDLLIYSVNSLDDRYDFASRETRGWQPITLLRDVQSVRINYFGARLTGIGSAWQVDWQQRPQPPALVRIRITFRPGDPRVWPDLIVRSRSTENTACKIDLRTGLCGAAA
ncbi:prepilin-type N-terminal cleavage/methylation domain-containing protein [Sphingomonas sp.]|uniref:prepilin-type N-terminal cleavage/methylation domain-containing protein n=1 Tax=Sphingomonas sp. TaxID=28214 RepID=UPI0025FC91DB|nr:prepilin-type N-terminal cleavage/methylation domain-containing protein [Sphingomonas sp.]